MSETRARTITVAEVVAHLSRQNPIIPTGLQGPHGGKRFHCRGCGIEARGAVVDMAYTYEICACGSPAFEHLVEHLWHRDCIRADR